MEDITIRHKKFLKEYLSNGGNAAVAAASAYPDQTYASQRVTGSRLLTNANIQKSLQDVFKQEGLTNEVIVKEVVNLINISTDNSDKCKVLRLAAEIIGLIGKNNVGLTNVNMSEPIFNSSTFYEMMDFIYKKTG